MTTELTIPQTVEVIMCLENLSPGAIEALGKITEEAERLATAEARYEKLRKLTPLTFSALYQRNLNGMGNFDGLVDLLPG